MPAGGTWRIGEVVDGRYQVLQVHRTGGMGLVYRVRHLEWRTDLAVKCPRAELFETEAQRERFVAEAEIWVSLGLHPNVCGCHYVRVLDGLPRVFAEYVPGGSLRDWIDDRRLYAGGQAVALARMLDVAVQFSRGLVHAHGRGLVHQDVKPGNVLLDVTADGIVAKVTDFGLARAGAVPPVPMAPDASAGVSMAVSSSGLTPAYASPEQVAGRKVGRRTDVYSFAVSVLEMFTGGIVWVPGAAEAMLAVRREQPEPGIPDLPSPLADLLERCLSMHPAERPASMAQVAGELIEVHRRVTGTPYPRSAPRAADLRADELNNRGLSLLDLGRPAEADEAFAAALAADPHHLFATYNTGLLRWRRGEHTDEDVIGALEATVSGDSDSGEARRQLAEVHRERGDNDRANALLDREATVRSGPSEGALRIPWYGYPAHVVMPSGERIPRQPPTMGVRFTGDGTRAVTACDGELRVWSVRDGRCLRELAAPGVEFTFDISDDGRFAITAEPNAVRHWDLSEGRCLRVLEAPEGWNRALWSASVRLSGNGRVAVSAHYDGTVLVRDFPGGALRLTLDGHDSGAKATISHDGRFVLTAGRQDRTVRLWEIPTGRCVRILDGRVLDGYRGVDTLCLSPDGSLAALAAGGTIRVWDLRRDRTHTLHGHTRVVRSMSVHGGFLVSTSADDTVRLWSLDGGGRCLRTFRGDGGPVAAAHLDTEAGVLRSAWRAGLLRWWAISPRRTAPLRLSRPREHAELNSLDARVTDLLNRSRLAPDPSTALELLAEARAVPGYEREPRLRTAWRELGRSAIRIGLRSAWPTKVFERSEGNDALELSADDRIAVSTGKGGTVRVWDVAGGTCLRVFTTRVNVVRGVGVSDDGTRVLAATLDGIATWSVGTGEQVGGLDRRLPLGAASPAFDRDGVRALVGESDGTIRLWNLDTGSCEQELSGHRRGVDALWLGEDLAASAGPDNVVRLWDPRTGQCLRSLYGHTHAVLSVCLSPDDRYVLSAGGYTDRTMRLWDTATGECLRVFGDDPDHPRGVDSVPRVQYKRVRFSPDGRFAISGGSDSTVRIWELATGRCLRVLDGHRNEVRSVVFSSDAGFALSSGADAVRRWELDWALKSP